MLTEFSVRAMAAVAKPSARRRCRPGSGQSVSIDEPELMAEEKLAIVLGTEGDGLGDGTIADCDYTVRIPMSHGVDSLNVAAASAVAFWQLGRR